MYLDSKVQTIHVENQSIQLFIPNQEEVKRVYKIHSEQNPNTPFPYWTQVWPSAMAMAQFIVQNPNYFLGKHVTELAAGLGLPSFVVAQFADKVYCTDYLQETIDAMKQSVQHLEIQNISCALVDWNNIPADFPKTDIVLMSDINYNPADFDILLMVLTKFIDQDCLIILTTPQRLLAKPFIEKLMPYCKLSQEIVVNHQNKEVTISVFVLHNRLIQEV